MPAMPPFPPWADLPPELLCRISDALDDLQSYTSARGACTAWRRTLAPPSPTPSLLLAPDDNGRRCPSAAPSSSGPCPWRHDASAPATGGSPSPSAARARSSASLTPSPAPRSSCRRSCTRADGPPSPSSSSRPTPPATTSPPPPSATGTGSPTSPPGPGGGPSSTPSPSPAGISSPTPSTMKKNGKGLVYCLTRYGDVHVLSLPERRRRKPIDDMRLLCAADQQHSMIRRAQPDLNAPAIVEPLLSIPFDPATSFAPPYNTLSAFTGAKNLVFCKGKLYQVWRNASCTVNVKLPGGGRRRVEENEVLVLRYYPRRKPCWDAVTDLGGHSVFLGRNNAVSMHAQGGALGIKENCVYWIGGRGRDQGMVFDMATGRTTACLLPPPAAGVAPQSTFCWYVLRA